MFPKVDAIVIDCETEKAVPPKNGDLIPGVQYCAGWTDYKGMGISVVCAYDLLRNRPIVYFKEDLADFIALVRQRKLVVGYNSARFDHRLISAHVGYQENIVLGGTEHYDILTESYKAAGLSTGSFTSAHKGFRLQDMTQANFGYGKVLDSELAPIEWQRGKRAAVVSKCFDDVMLCVELFYKILNDGGLLHPSGSDKFLKFRAPFTVEDAVLRQAQQRITYDSVAITDQRQIVAYDATSNRAIGAPKLKDLPPALVPEIQPPLFEGVPDKVIGWHKAAEVKPQGGDKSGHELRESEEVD